jgi:glucokinase
VTPLDGHVPVLEVGGTHVTAALVSLAGSMPVVVERHRAELAADAVADEITNELAGAAGRLRVHDSRAWGIAIPGPFDYSAGVGRFAEVGKFDSLNGFDLGGALRRAMIPSPRKVVFVNDADAFGLGACTGGQAREHDRVVCITLGTGVGSAFIATGTPIHHGPTVPPGGSAHLLTWQGRPLEHTVSRRAIRARYRELGGGDLDVDEIAQAARAGEASAKHVLDVAMRALGETLAPWIESFEATIVVVGGSITRSWDLLEPPFRQGVTTARPNLGIAVEVAALPEDAPLIGTAAFVIAESREQVPRGR